MNYINELLSDALSTPITFEEYLNSYAEKVGDLVNEFIPRGSHVDMDRYLYAPLAEYSKNGGKRHRPLICFASCIAIADSL